MISKKLLQQVLKSECADPELKLIEPSLENDWINYATVFKNGNNTTRTISLRTLSFRCILWAREEYSICINIMHPSPIWYCTWDYSSSEYPQQHFEADTEYEAVFNACQYILNNETPSPWTDLDEKPSQDLVEEVWIPKDKEPVWCWDNNDPFDRRIRYWSTKWRRPYSFSLQGPGSGYENYDKVEHIEPWMLDAQSRLKD